MVTSPPRPEASDVRAWVARAADFAADPARVNRAIGWMTPGERARYARFRHDPDRWMFALGREMARTLVAEALGVPPDAWSWREGPHGRPEISAPATDLRFNVSHSAGLVVCALGCGFDVGVDLEDLTRRAPDPAVVPRYCSPAETRDVLAHGDRWCDQFLIYWTLKEAYLKARGLGISVHLADISFSLGDPIRVSFTGALAGTDDRWAFHLQRLDASHLAALAAHAPDGRRPRFTVQPY